MSKRDYYEILGLAKNASDDDIKQAYRRLAMKYHPDRNQGTGQKEAEEKFKEAKEAYETLSDAQKKAAYDQYGHSNPFQHSTNGSQTRSWTFKDGNNAQFEDMFKDIFGEHFGAFNQQRRTRQILTVSLEDAYKGRYLKLGNSTIHLPPGTRNGTRFFVDSQLFEVQVKPHTKFKRAEDDLLVDVEINAIEGMLGVATELEHLDGLALEFTIPAGIQNGQVIKLSGKGMKNPEFDKYGDLLIRVTVTTPRGLTEEQKEFLKTMPHRDKITL